MAILDYFNYIDISGLFHKILLLSGTLLAPGMKQSNKLKTQTKKPE